MSKTVISTKNILKKTCKSPNPNPSSLSPYSGDWTWAEASHLLRRTMFGPTFEQITESVNQGLENTIFRLFSPQEEAPLPINYYFENDPEVPIGETWVGKPATPDVQGLLPARNASLSAWSFGLMMESNVSILEKMILFWHNHLVISDIFPPNAKYSYMLLLRKYALGDFKQFVKDMTIEPAMLFYLNGNENTAIAPNENFARELMELFTIGKGPLVGDGDYTNYTEQDVVEFARALSGWVVRGDGSSFRPFRHDIETKQLSHRFGNKIINNLGENEYKRVVDILFEQEEVSKFICRQLYIWFLNYEISDDVEANVIEPMAQILRDSDYVIEPVIKALLKSEHFYSECIKGAIIKSPIDFTLGLLKTGEFPMPDQNNIINKYKLSNLVLRRVLRPMEQIHFGIPSVAGWPAYYQEPVYYRIWLSSVTLPLRKALVETMVRKKTKVGDQRVGLELLDLVAKFDAPQDPNKLLKSLTDLFLSYDLTDEQYKYLKTEVLIPGLPDYEWTVEYNDYINNPGDEQKANAILKQLQEVMSVMMNLPEFQMT